MPMVPITSKVKMCWMSETAKLKIGGTAAVASKFVTSTGPLPSLDNARQAAAGKITSEERKAEGLAD